MLFGFGLFLVSPSGLADVNYDDPNLASNTTYVTEMPIHCAANAGSALLGTSCARTASNENKVNPSYDETELDDAINRVESVNAHRSAERTHARGQARPKVAPSQSRARRPTQ